MNGSVFVVLFSLLSIFLPTIAKSSEEWRSRVIYQLLTDRFAVDDGSTDTYCDVSSLQYCGGTWKGISTKLDYIADMGFTAIWISPIDKNIEGEQGTSGWAYHGYWNTDYKSLNSHFGSESDLISMITAAHNLGIWVMFDTIANSMAVNGSNPDFSYSTLVPFNAEKYFHPYCVIDWDTDTDDQIVDCWTNAGVVTLADLDLENSDVSDYLYSQVKSVVSKYSVDGIRVDSAKQMNTSFFPDYVSNAGVFALGEVFSYDPNMMCKYMKYSIGSTNYPLQLKMNFSFTATGAGMTLIESLYESMSSNSNCSGVDRSLTGTFIENHDLQRFASYTSDQANIMGAIAFVLVWDGIPIIYYGQEQGFSGAADPLNREALWSSGYDTTNPYYTLIKSLVHFRRTVMSQDSTYVTTLFSFIESARDHMIAQKNKVLVVFANVGVSVNSTTYTISSNFSSGVVLSEIIHQKTATVGSGGVFEATMTNGYPLIFYPSASLASTSVYTVNLTIVPTTEHTGTTTVTTSYYKPTYSARTFTGSGSVFTLSAASSYSSSSLLILGSLAAAALVTFIVW
ncbi:alpha-amylase Aah3 [Schizosaccharomyces japonicus yFS275]|uniref:alpha-amylase n=1 Tax=Schizosaccharomyces japonicus (strain yFS275 / FY16936) TaxID=402676 RepID=B6K6B0_SCHJY|nr:alpha-amylase Aah3 [Schizosaccharomyces japonicus yFS275]EEB09064.1 alpha-amylase Aah3 [Schizosaccharomyces japonicus yFS275]